MSLFVDQPIPSLEDLAEPITSPIVDGPPDLIPGLLPRNGELVVAGETDIGKSLLALEICSSLITGEPLWGELHPTKQAKKILYILGEHYNDVIKRLWQVTRLPMSDQVFLLGPEQLKYDKWLVAKGQPNELSIKKYMRWAEGVDFIVFDPLAAFITGVDVENDNMQMRLLLDSMSLVSQANGASCLVLAHQGKPMMDRTGQEHSRKTYAIRGASGIEDAATNIFYMGKADGVQAKGDHMLLTLKRRKYKGVAPEEYRLMRDPHTLTHTVLGNRPAAEVQKIDTLAKIARLQSEFPDMAFAQVIKAVGAVQGLSERSIRRYLQMDSA